MNQVECQAFIKDFFEQYYLKLSQEADVMLKRPNVDKEMWYDENQQEEWKKWKLVPSTITEKELNKLEKEIGTKFPVVFRIFLSTYFHYFEDGIGVNSFSKPFKAVKNAWNPMLVKVGYLPFTWDEDGYFIRCIKLDAMPDEEKCGVYQIDYEIMFNFDEDTLRKEEIDANMEYISTNFFTYLKERLV